MIEAMRERARALFGEGEALPIHLVGRRDGAADLGGLEGPARAWAEATGFGGEAGAFALVPGLADGAARPVAVLAGTGAGPAAARVGALPRQTPARFAEDGALIWRLEGADLPPARAALDWALGAYRFERYKASEAPQPLLLKPDLPAAEERRLIETIAAVYLARDLVNTPTSDLGPEALEAAAAALAAAHGAAFEAIRAEALLKENLPMIHAVGRGGSEAPRLLDLTWGDPAAPKLTLVGKGVCFDTGGLNLKPGRSMRNMKKDMGGSAAALALAHLVMALALPVRLRVLIPAVENNVDAVSFRPGDILRSRKGLTVEIGDTDAEGRLVLADALALADEEAPATLIDFATLTGAARVALGPELPPFYTADEAFAAALAAGAAATGDPLWRMPLWDGYESDLASKAADLCNVSATGFAGSITAALFLRRFVAKAEAWAHLDIFAWNPKTRPGRPEGGEAQGVLAALHALEARFGSAA